MSSFGVAVALLSVDVRVQRLYAGKFVFSLHKVSANFD